MEELFAQQLEWGNEASWRLQTHVFYGYKGKADEDAEHLTTVLAKVTKTYLDVELGVSEWRHLCTAMGRVFIMWDMEPDDAEWTNTMDAQAGRNETTSDRIYALQSTQLGHLNPRLWAKFLAVSRLWHVRALKLKVKGRLADLEEILAPDADLHQNGSGRGNVKSKALGIEDVRAMMEKVVLVQEASIANICKRMISLENEVREGRHHMDRLEAKVDTLINVVGSMRDGIEV